MSIGPVLTAGCVLAESTDTGLVPGSAVNTMAYWQGNFNERAIVLAPAYTMTAKDKDDFKKVEVLISDSMTYAPVTGSL